MESYGALSAGAPGIEGPKPSERKPRPALVTLLVGMVAFAGLVATAVQSNGRSAKREGTGTTLAALKGAAEKGSETGRPHILFFYIDDQGFGDMGPHSDLHWSTPTINKLGKEGIVLDRYYGMH